MNQTIPDILHEALQKIADEHGIAITELSAEWMDSSSCGRPRALIFKTKFYSRSIK